MAAVGIAEGTSHVNWRLLAKILLWWIVGFCLTMVTTSALIAQGKIIGPIHLGCAQAQVFEARYMLKAKALLFEVEGLQCSRRSSFDNACTCLTSLCELSGHTEKSQPGCL